MELYYLDTPLYWKLNPSFNGDRILSYGGYLRFSTVTVNPGHSYPQFNKYPLVILQGNDLELFYYPIVPNLNNNHHEIRLHESLWKNANSIYGSVTRQLLMIVLQNVKNIYIKGSDFTQFDKLM